MRQLLLLCVAASVLTAPALAGGFVNDLIKGVTGGAVDVEQGEVCAGPWCINTKGQGRTKSPNEIVDDVIGAAAPVYTTLPQDDKDRIRDAAVKTGVILAATTTDPITGAVIITIIANGKKNEAPIPNNPKAPTTGIKYTLSAACLALRDATSLTAAFTEQSDDLKKVKVGDEIALAAPFCPSIGGTAVTSATIIATSPVTAINVDGSPYKWILLGTLRK